jgi:hypothetical protein
MLEFDTAYSVRPIPKFSENVLFFLEDGTCPLSRNFGKDIHNNIQCYIPACIFLRCGVINTTAAAAATSTTTTTTLNAGLL